MLPCCQSNQYILLLRFPLSVFSTTSHFKSLATLTSPYFITPFQCSVKRIKYTTVINFAQFLIVIYRESGPYYLSPFPYVFPFPYLPYVRPIFHSRPPTSISLPYSTITSSGCSVRRVAYTTRIDPTQSHCISHKIPPLTAHTFSLMDQDRDVIYI